MPPVRTDLARNSKGEFVGFRPEQDKWLGIFSSIKNDLWKRHLEAVWDERYPDSDPDMGVETPGYINCLMEQRYFATWQELERAYYKTFEKLRSEDRLFLASLRKGDVRLHSWARRSIRP